MKLRKSMSLKLGMAGLLIAALGIAWAATAPIKLLINGKVATTEVRVINGQAYAPISAVAKALNMTVAKTSAGYEMSVPGGTLQVSGAKQGKIGEWLFTGKWRFQVVSVSETNEYTERYYQEGKTKSPSGSGDVLIVVDCKLKNGMKQQASPVLTERMPRNTALADDKGHSYAPMDCDARQKENKIASYEAEPLLPGAQSDFALVFSVPKGTQPKALVFTAFAYPPPQESKEDDVRVTLE